MSATPRQMTFSEEDLAPRKTYDDIMPGDYEAFLEDVEDVEAASGNYGWAFKFIVEGLPLRSKLWLRGNGGWKVAEVFAALGSPIQPGGGNLNPATLIGRTCIVTVARKPRYDDPESTYLEIVKHTPMLKEEAPSL